MDSLISLAIMEGAILLCSEESRTMMVWFRVPDPELIFDGIKDFIDGESQQSEVLSRFEGSKWIW